ncbi:MAG: DUF362 domain-containing protein [Phycisphaerae bacterium]|nr:DUF362 domain-containing protein [Phycisphaerae bacterium]
MDSKVYFIKASLSDGEKAVSEKAAILFKAGNFQTCFKENDFTAVKIHVGEGPNTTYLRAPCIKGLIEELLRLKTKPFLTDTSTLYSGRRSNAIEHCLLADEHGFNIANLKIPFIPTDGLFGTSETAVKINGQLNKEVLIAEDITRCQSILSIAHFTGHVATCAAATLKTLGMGCASRKGKMRQHSALKPKINDNCVLCGECYRHCPVDAISLAEKKANIDSEKCIGGGECIAVCRYDAVEYDWGKENKQLQQDIAEHALGAVKGKQDRCVFFNFLVSIADSCDCFDIADLPLIVEDIGIMASNDPVAVDKASLDMIEQVGGKSLGELIKQQQLDPNYQLEHAEKIGLGSTKYELIEVE